MNWQRRNPYFVFRGSGDAPEPAGRLADRNVWPVTYLMLQSVEGGAQLFFYIVATLYAAELIWRERDTRFSGIHGALPISETTDWFSKLFALCFIEFVLLTITGLCGVLMQTIAGYLSLRAVPMCQRALLHYLSSGPHLRLVRALCPDCSLQ